MNIREIIILALMSLAWGFHFVIVKIAVAEVPPIFYAALRMTLVASILLVFLRWRPGHMGRVIAAAVCLGSLNYALMFTGVGLATASSTALAFELYVPFATILSIVFLGDRVGWRRGVGIAFAFFGVALIAITGRDDPSGAKIGIGVGLVAAAAFCEAVGAILVKQSTAFKPHELLAWFSLVGAICLWGLTALFEQGQRAALVESDKAIVVSAVLYSALAASLFGHTAYYWLIHRLPMTIVAPSTLMVTVIAVASGVILLGEPLTAPIMVGAAMTLIGVGIVVLRSAKKQDMKAPITDPSSQAP